MLYDGLLAQSFPLKPKTTKVTTFDINGTVQEVSANFNIEKKDSPFGDVGIMINRQVLTVDSVAIYDGVNQMLGDVLVDEKFVPNDFFISAEDLPKWEYEKGAKKINRVSKDGFEYVFSEGSMAFPDFLDRPSRTMITGEGGNAPSRFKHVVLTPSGKHRRLIPIELERLNMFPDNHTYHPEVSDGRRAFLMGNALVCGIVEQIGKYLYKFIYNEEPVSSRPIHVKRDACPTLDFGLFPLDEVELVVNKPKRNYTLDNNKRLLIGLVKVDNQDYFLKQEPTKIYYTGKTKSFPSTIALNKLYYFMPYIKGKGVKDLYLIRIARIGNKAEIHPSTNDKEPRLVFELVYLESLSEYKPVRLNINYTYNDTFLGNIFD
jgi:DNA (cytosine-5)-methyltransferase 1